MNDRSERRTQQESNKAKISRKRGLEAGNDRGLSESWTGREVRSKRAKIENNIAKEPSPDVHGDQANKRLVAKELSVSEERIGNSRNAERANSRRNTYEDRDKTSNSPVRESEGEIDDSHVNIEQLCASGVSEMFFLKKAGWGPPIMLLKISYQVARGVQGLISTGLTYRHKKDILMSKIEDELRLNKLLGADLLQRGKDLQKAKGEDKPNTLENRQMQRMRQQANDLDKEKQEIEARKVTLLRDVECAREAWENAVWRVDTTLQNVFVRSGLFDKTMAADVFPVTPQIDEPGHKPLSDIKQPAKITVDNTPVKRPVQEETVKKVIDNRPAKKAVEDTPAKKAADDRRFNFERVALKTREAKARRELLEAQIQYDQHRGTFRRGLAAYIDGAVNRPDVTKCVLEEEFSRDYVRVGSELAQVVARAEAAHEALLAAAADAQVTIIDPDDDMDPNIPYTDEEWAAVKMKYLDYDAIDTWKKGVHIGAKPNLRPAGYVLHMAEKWQQALEADEDVSISGEGSVSDTESESDRDSSAVHDSKSRNESKKLDWYLSISECADSKKKRRIEDWTQKRKLIEP